MDQISCLPLDAASHWSDTFYAKPRACCFCGTALSKGEIHPASTNQTEAKTNKTELEKNKQTEKCFQYTNGSEAAVSRTAQGLQTDGGHGVVELVAICVCGLCMCLGILENTQSSLQKKTKAQNISLYVLFYFFLSFIIYYYL